MGDRQSRRETKWQSCEESDVRIICGNRQVKWVAKNFVGASRGLLTVWDQASFLLCGNWVGNFSIVVILESVVDGFQWCLVNSYGPCDRLLKESFIRVLRDILQWWRMPMCIVGDMNTVRSLEEVSGGGGRSRAEMNLLNGFIADEELIDLPLSGDYKVHVLTRVCSDHNPLLVVTSQFGALRRPWRFELMWLEHDNFGSFLQQVWNAELEGSGGFFRVAKRLKVLKEKLKEWNRDIFKCNESEIGRCLALVVVLDGEEERGEWSEEKRIRRCMIKLELDKLLRRQEISWKQKSKEVGLTLGDRNTKFFHKMACHNQRRNTMDRLEVNGLVVEDQALIAQAVVSYYMGLYSEDNPLRNDVVPPDYTKPNSTSRSPEVLPFRSPISHSSTREDNAPPLKAASSSCRSTHLRSPNDGSRSRNRNSYNYNLFSLYPPLPQRRLYLPAAPTSNTTSSSFKCLTLPPPSCAIGRQTQQSYQALAPRSVTPALR
ncbi:hypothetical protein LINGRAHAP2_LOCUS1391 [Linum grandiflorum]